MKKQLLTFFLLSLPLWLSPAMAQDKVSIPRELNADIADNVYIDIVKTSMLNKKKRAFSGNALQEFINELWPGTNIKTVDDVDAQLRVHLREVFGVFRNGLRINGVVLDPWNLGPNKLSFNNFISAHPMVIYHAEDNRNRPVVAPASSAQRDSAAANRPSTIRGLLSHLVHWRPIQYRECFSGYSISKSQESLKASLAHELAHHYLYDTYPDLSSYNSNRLEAIVAAEAFCVYIEYMYLRTRMAALGKEFTLRDFISDTSAFVASPTTHNRLYGIHPDYMICFLQGLDWDKLIFNARGEIDHIPFRNKFLDDILTRCKNQDPNPYMPSFNNSQVTATGHMKNLVNLPMSHVNYWNAYAREMAIIHKGGINVFNMLDGGEKQDRKNREMLQTHHRKGTIRQALEFIRNSTQRQLELH